MIALALIATLVAQHDPPPSVIAPLRLPAFLYPLLYTTDLPACSADTGCVLDVRSTSTTLVATDSANASVPLTNATANGMETAPMVTASGATYGATITSTAPNIAAGSVPEAVRTLWSADHTCLFAVNPRDTAAARYVIGYGNVASDGVYLLSSSAVVQASWRGAGASVDVNASTGNSATNEWNILAMRKSGTTFSVCVNGTCNSAVNALAIGNPDTSRTLYLGANSVSGERLNGAFSQARCYSSALSDATIQLRTAQLLKGLATRPADTYVTTTRSGAAFDVYADGFVYASGDNIRIPHSTKGLASYADHVELASFAYAFDNAAWDKGAVTVTPNADSGLFSRIAGGAEADRLVSTGAGATLRQTIAVTASTAYKFYFWAKNNGGTAASYSVYCDTLAAEIVTPTSYFAQLNSSAYTKIMVPFTTPAGCTSVGVYVLRDSGNTVDLFASGAHVVLASSPDGPCPRADGTARTCNADVHTVPTPVTLSRTEGCACMTITPSWTGVVPDANVHQFLNGTAANAWLAYAFTDDQFKAYDGTNVVAVAAGFTNGVGKRYCTDWSAAGNYLRVTNVATAATSSVPFSTFSAFGATLGLGSAVGGGSQANTHVKDLKIDSRPGRCN